MPFRIRKSVSTRAWGDVDKSSIWGRLKTGLQEGAEGVAAAVREVYAAVKAAINADLTEADCWGPHHEVSPDGTVTLNRGGVIAAAGALAGARAEPDLTPEQKASARTHIRRHYRELDMPVPASLGGEGEVVGLTAYITGEMSVHEVPLGTGIDIAALKQGDPDPMEVVVEIPSGKSKRGWNYTLKALQDIAQEVMSSGLLGFLGHQKVENVDHEFPTPVTHWVGAKVDSQTGRLYLRGVIDKAAADLKRWIRARSVRTTSIFGVPKLETAGGETQVVGYVPLSNDWAPPGREGMATRVVAWGEMDDEIITGGGETKAMNWKELVAKLKDMLKAGEVTLKQIAGELGLTLDAAAEAVDAEAYKALKAASDSLGKLKETLGVKGEMDVLAVAKSAAEALTEKARAEHEKLLDETVKAKVSGEIAQDLVRKMLKVAETATKEQIVGEIDKLLGDEKVKGLFSKLHLDVPVPVATATAEPADGYLKTRQVSI